MKKFSTISYILSATVLIFAGFLVARGAWNPPPYKWNSCATPADCSIGTCVNGFCQESGPAPMGNAPEPINVSANTQTKAGGINTFGGFLGNGLGIAGPSLFYNGDIKLGRPDIRNAVSNSLFLQSWANTIQTLYDGNSSPTIDDAHLQGTTPDDCPAFKNANGTVVPAGDTNTQFSCQGYVNNGGNIGVGGFTTCTDVFLYSNTHYKTTITCDSGKSNYAIKNNAGIFQISGDSGVGLTLNQGGSLNVNGVAAGSLKTSNLNVDGSAVMAGAILTNGTPITFSSVKSYDYYDPNWSTTLNGDTCDGNNSAMFSCTGQNQTCTDEFDYYTYINGKYTKQGTYDRQVICTSGSYLINNDAGVLKFISAGTTNFSIDQTGKAVFISDVKANKFLTGDLIFNHNGKPVWRMYEDENGLYAQSPITGKKYRMMMEEIK